MCCLMFCRGFSRHGLTQNGRLTSVRVQINIKYLVPCTREGTEVTVLRMEQSYLLLIFDRQVGRFRVAEKEPGPCLCCLIVAHF